MRNIYLIQRCHIQKGYDKNSDLYETIKRDYMGAAEFEFGALPKSLRRMKENTSNYKMSKWGGCDRPGEYVLRIWHPFNNEEFEAYKEQLSNVFEGKQRLKEWCYFVRNPTTNNPEDFWWDIQNDVMWSYDKYFMDDLSNILQNTFRLMED